MILWAVVPAKDPARAKSRLARVVTPEQRRAISLALLERTLRVLRQAPAVAQTLVISDAAEPLALAQRNGATPIHEIGLGSDGRYERREDEQADMMERTLNAALRQAAWAAIDRRVDALLVLPADLPCLTPAALMALIGSQPAMPGLVLAPDRHHSGTNAMLVAPPGALPFSFGRASFARHREIAARHSLPMAVFDHPAFSLDLDEPDDIDVLTGVWAIEHTAEHEDIFDQLIHAILPAGDQVTASEHCA